ncbi:hypothetical protein [Streptomyces endophytica]|uniref:EamA/RhaT family transporter n=1 Tax=Streptomyces endophytica TaxID=2991496 RepID=A0ABY6P9L6_9ACTN|nr:hypothetical protein [Streptomyces endophytica]UZJ30170.1 hypothetical protein OJ254_06790 [Streptomyces endophytica]
MSDEQTPPPGPPNAGGPGNGPESGPVSGPESGAESDGPQPEPIRFFGTTWVHHDGGYALRRAGVAVGSLALAAAGAVVLRFAFQGLEIAAVGPFVGILVVAGFAICSALAFRRTWDGFVRRPGSSSSAGAADTSGQSLMLIGFIGSLLAYFCRSLVEAPGERLHRAEYAEARERHERRRSTRTGNPAARKSKNPKRPKNRR